MPTNEDQQEQTTQVKKGWKKLILMFSVILIILIAGAATGMHFTSQPNFCYSCHEIQPHVISWREGLHNEVTCLKCHANPGTIGYVSRKLKGLGELYLHSTNQIPEKIEARYNIDTCIVCHTGNEGYAKAKNIKLESGDNAPRISHQEILTSKVVCLICHGNVGHKQSL